MREGDMFTWSPETHDRLGLPSNRPKRWIKMKWVDDKAVMVYAYGDATYEQMLPWEMGYRVMVNSPDEDFFQELGL